MYQNISGSGQFWDLLQLGMSSRLGASLVVGGAGIAGIGISQSPDIHPGLNHQLMEVQQWVSGSVVSSGTSPQARHFIQAGLSSVTSILVWTPIDGGSAISVGEAGTTIDSGSLVSSGTAPTSGAVEDSGINKWGISSTLTSNSIEVGSAGGVGGVGTTRCWGTGKLKTLCSAVETGSSTAGDRWAGTSGLRGRNSSQISPAATSTISLGSTEAMVSIPSRGTLCQERLDHVIAGGVGDNDSGNSRFIKITF